MGKGCVCCTNRFTFVLACFSPSTLRLLCKGENRGCWREFWLFCPRHHCLVQCVLRSEYQDLETLCLSLFSSLSTGSLVPFKRHRVGGRGILRLLWRTWMWAKLRLRLLEQLYDRSGFSVTIWGLIVSQKVRLSLQPMIDWQLELLHSVSLGFAHAVDYGLHSLS